jgi:hypothetical protein
MKSQIMRTANKLCELLERCGDENFVDEVIFRVSCNDPFDEEQIEEVEA